MKHLSLFLAVVALLATHCHSDEKPNPSSDRVVLRKGIVGLWMMGQSLCDGSESLPIITPNDSGWGNYRFKRGVRTWSYGNHCDKPELRPDEQFAYVPLTATKNGGLGETIANGLADHLRAASFGSDRNIAALETKSPHFLAAYARAPIRYVSEDDGITVLRFENRERRNNKDFAVGQTLTTLRPFSYGNLRDSDPEKAIYRFADSAYGTRAGQSYPLWNWCVLFNQFLISER